MKQDFVNSEQKTTEIDKHELSFANPQQSQAMSKATKTAVSPAPGRQGRPKSKEGRNSSDSSGLSQLFKSILQSQGFSSTRNYTRNSSFLQSN